MSGSPIYKFEDDKPKLIGIYTGCRYTLIVQDRKQAQETFEDQVNPYIIRSQTSLGTGCSLIGHFSGLNHYSHVDYAHQKVNNKAEWGYIFFYLNADPGLNQEVISEAMELLDACKTIEESD